MCLRFSLAAFLAAGLSWACDPGVANPPPELEASESLPVVEASEPDLAAASDAHEGQELEKIVALGDSLTAGYGLDLTQAYPALLQERLDAKGYAYEVVNAGVSGDTTAGGLRRLDWVMQGDVSVVIVALGGNDGLRGLPPAEMKRNLAAIIGRARAGGASVLLAGMEAPPNQGERYTSEFRHVFQDLADEHEVVFLPFLLKDLAGVSALNQRDGIHPNVEGASILADNVWTYLAPLLEEEVAAAP